jgi:hypothetical protein
LNRSWGVVDDTCDGIIEAQVVIKGRRFVATSRVFSSCPDYAPDRRPFYSIADDLADRDLPLAEVNADTISDTEREIADLFARAFETASLFNLDAMRERAITENMAYDPPPNANLPEIDKRSMTEADRGIEEKELGHKVPPHADLTADLFPYPSSKGDVPGFQLPYSAAAQFKHEALCDIETLLDLLMAKGERVKHLVRPPFGRFGQLPKRPATQPNPSFRDPRVYRDGFHDMRMPPYMRDSDLMPLSITYRQYDALIRLITCLEQPLDDRPNTPIARRIDELKTRTDELKKILQTVAPELQKKLGEDY